MGLRLVPVDQAVGLRLGQKVLDTSNRTMLTAGTTLTATMAKSLKARGYCAVHVQDDLAPDLIAQESVREEVRFLAASRTKEIFRQLASKQGTRPAIQVAPLREVVDGLLADIQGRSNSLWNISTLRAVSEYTFVHSVNTAVYSLLLGMAAGFDRPALRVLGLGALLHDIGKVYCVDLTEKPEPLTAEEYERVKRHSSDGYQILRTHPEIDLLAAHIAYQHHERLDGTGYPRQLQGERIIRFAQIAAIADVYDAMTADRPYRAAMPQANAMAEVLKGADRLFDGYLVRLFASRLAVYPVGTIVLLTSGEIAVVSRDGRSPDKPLVRVLTDKRDLIDRPYEVNLSNPPNDSSDELAIQTVLADYPKYIQAQMQRRGNVAPTL